MKHQTNSCGCLKDLSGKQFGRLFIIEYAYSRNGEKIWKCQCSCIDKAITYVSTRNLNSNHTLSCGCYAKERISETNKKYNIYNLTSEYGIGYTSKKEEFYFDLKDYDLIKNYCWYKNEYGYILTVVNKENLFLHRLVLNNFNMSIDIDHYDGIPYNNKKNNLRICTHQENTFNSKIRSNNTSGYTGVCYNKKWNMWVSYITVNYKKIHLGSFVNKDNAIKIRIEAEQKYFGEYSYLNRPQFQEINFLN